MEQISKLLFKYINGTLREDEVVQLEQWANADPANRKILQGLDKDGDLLADLKAWYTIPVKTLSDDKRLDLEITKHERRSIRYRLSKWLPYAAAAVFVLTMGYFFLESNLQETKPELSDILSGGNRATLTLDDGRTIELSTEQDGITVGDEISYLDGSLVTPSLDNPSDMDNGDPDGTNYGPLRTQYAILHTPKGGIYQVVLPDGSKVWMNASSRLRYPTVFEHQERVVELEGEAYFEITKSANQPFKVVSNHQTVEVLGTSFNISAYPNEETKTTLVNGVVEVASHQTKGVRRLAPGQQATMSGTAVMVKDVNIGQYIGWKEGKIVLEGRTLAEILKEVSRWYDIEVRYEGDIPKGTFFGRVNRSNHLGTVLRLLESANMDYEMEGRTLVVKARKK